MRYVGSKNKISRELAPIIQSYITEETNGYLEPFVGGANMIDKIKCKNKIGCDIHKELIALLKKTQESVLDIPNTILEDEYIRVRNNKQNYDDWYVGLVGFCASFGAKYFGGYARNGKEDDSGKWSTGAIKNLKKQSEKLKSITFKCCSFLELKSSDYNGYVIYCDIPYKGTTKYTTKSFPYDEFYEWAKEMAKTNTVLISEYDMPDDFECIWSKETRVNFDSNRKMNDDKNKRIEKLFIVKK